MDFVTLPQLARDLNIPERRVRHRFRRLVAAGKLVEGKDFNKEEFQDEFHFTYMIHPQHFIQEAKFQKEAEDALRDRTDLLPPGTNIGNNSQPTDNKMGATLQPSGGHVDNQQLPSASDLGTKQNEDDVAMVAWLRKQIDDKEAELKEWRGLLPDYQKAVNQLIAAERELRRLGPGPAPEDPQPGTEDVINMPSSGKPAEEAPIETEGESGGEEPES